MINLDVRKKLNKFLVMGLDNSGKTSILLSLREDTNIMSFTSLSATRGLQIEEIKVQDNIITCWDFGGQEKYREEYLINFERYADKADKLIFVIDIQDLDRYGFALDYLRKIIDLLLDNNKSIDFSIFLHKYDPNLGKIEKFKNIDEKINSELVDRIINLMSSNFNYKIFKTTIYSVFDKFLINENKLSSFLSEI